ncbi:MAG TPA: ribosome maturation factor RimP [Verrucomicrobiae bacterium]|jgi:ribosome maturation factor RimP|nr:ribosome maturation factor RimP [Verrucomicrobiae bacterium]
MATPGNVQAAFEEVVASFEHDGAFPELEIVAHLAQRKGRSTALTVTIDQPGGVAVGLCERVAARINDHLEEFDEPYSLEVESAGLERPLTKPGDYERFAGKAVRVTTTLRIEGGKTHRGVLRGVRGTNVILEIKSGELPLPLATIKSANLEYDPRADLQRDKRERKNHG